MNEFKVEAIVRDIELLLDIVKHILELDFDCDQPQELFDRLPEHRSKPARLQCIFRLRPSKLKTPKIFQLYCLIVDSVRKLFESLKFLDSFKFVCANKAVLILITGLKKLSFVRRRFLRFAANTAPEE